MAMMLSSLAALAADCAPMNGNCFESECCADEGFSCYRRVGVMYAQCKPTVENCLDNADWLCPSWTDCTAEQLGECTKTRCCKEHGRACFKNKHTDYAQCRKLPHKGRGLSRTRGCARRAGCRARSPTRRARRPSAATKGARRRRRIRPATRSRTSTRSAWTRARAARSSRQAVHAGRAGCGVRQLRNRRELRVVGVLRAAHAALLHEVGVLRRVPRGLRPLRRTPRMDLRDPRPVRAAARPRATLRPPDGPVFLVCRGGTRGVRTAEVLQAHPECVPGAPTRRPTTRPVTARDGRDGRAAKAARSRRSSRRSWRSR